MKVAVPDLSDVLLVLGVALVAWTIYLLAPLWTPAVVGTACLIAGVLKGLASRGDVQRDNNPSRK